MLVSKFLFALSKKGVTTIQMLRTNGLKYTRLPKPDHYYECVKTSTDIRFTFQCISYVAVLKMGLQGLTYYLYKIDYKS